MSLDLRNTFLYYRLAFPAVKSTPILTHSPDWVGRSFSVMEKSPITFRVPSQLLQRFNNRIPSGKRSLLIRKLLELYFSGSIKVDI